MSGWTKQQFVEEAFAEVALAGYTFDLGPEQLQSALRRLDSMMAMWNAKGIRLGYPLPSSPSASSLATETDVPDSANEAIYTNLAIRIAGGYGKTVTLETKQTAKQGYDLLLSLAAMPGEMRMPTTLPLGAGNKPWRQERQFVYPAEDTLDAGQDSAIDFE